MPSADTALTAVAAAAADTAAPAAPSRATTDTSVVDLLDDTAARRPDTRAVTDDTGSWTFAELRAHTHAVAAWLRRRGVQPGDRVVVQLPTDRTLVALFYATVRVGAVFVPLNPQMKPFQLHGVLSNAQPALVIVPAEHTVRFGELTPAAVHAIEDVVGAARGLLGEPVASPVVTGIDLAALVYTSGSTSAPKAVMCAHGPVVFATRALVTALDYREDDIVFCRFPMSWDYGLYKVLMATVAGCEIVLAGEGSDLRLLQRMRETGATIVPIVPSLASMIATLARRETDLPPVRMFTNTGAALPAATIEALREHFTGVRVVRQFGQTECKRISVMPPDEDRDNPQSVGRPLPGTTVQIIGADGVEVPIGVVGEIVVSGPHVMPGYWRNAEQTARNFRRDPATGERRLHTGDYGHLDDDGYLYFDGRRDDMFKRKGIRMSTLEIEAAAMDIPHVRAAAALPPTERRDLTVVVAGDIAPQVVLRELARRLEPQKVPASCQVVAEVPLTAHGKNSRESLLALVDGAVDGAADAPVAVAS